MVRKRRRRKGCEGRPDVDECAKRVVSCLPGAALHRRARVPHPSPLPPAAALPAPLGSREHNRQPPPPTLRCAPTGLRRPFLPRAPPPAAPAAIPSTPAPPTRTKNSTKPNVTHIQKKKKKQHTVGPHGGRPHCSPPQLPLLAPTPAACARGTQPQTPASHRRLGPRRPMASRPAACLASTQTAPAAPRGGCTRRGCPASASTC